MSNIIPQCGYLCVIKATLNVNCKSCYSCKLFMKDQTIELADELDAAIANGPQINNNNNNLLL